MRSLSNACDVGQHEGGSVVHSLLTWLPRAPVMKWGVVAAGASDFLRPAEKLSLTQNLALMATGSIWTRWCFVIIPKNMLYVYLSNTGASLRLQSSNK